MGKAYHMLPQWLVMKCTMNREYWLRKKKAVTDDDDNDASRGADRGFCYHHDIYDAQDTPGKVQIEAAMFWVIMALILVVFAVVPGAADLCARLLGIYSTPNFLFLFMIFLLIVKAFGMTIQLSQLESKQRELIQKMALEQKFLEEKEAELEEREAALETCGKGE